MSGEGLLSVVLHQASCHDPAPDELACPHDSLVETVNQMQQNWEIAAALTGAVVVLSVVMCAYGRYTDE